MIQLTAPRFWYQKASWRSAVLWPLSVLYRVTTKLRTAFATPYKSSLRVICIGNVTAGGAGKTPVAIALVHATAANRPVFLMRGYRGTSAAATLVTKPDAAIHGDEAVVLAEHAPVIVAKDRAAGLRLAETSGFDLVIADDGFQNPHFIKSASVLVFDGGVGIGNGAYMPAGPLREPLREALLRANAAVVIGDDKTNLRGELFSVPVFGAAFDTSMRPSGRYLAFAGIGRPDKFFDTLKRAGFDLAETVSFPDHHAYSDSDMERLYSLAQRHQAHLITTEKDRVRLSARHAAMVTALPVTLEIEDIAGLVAQVSR